MKKTIHTAANIIVSGISQVRKELRLAVMLRVMRKPVMQSVTKPRQAMNPARKDACFVVAGRESKASAPVMETPRIRPRNKKVAFFTV